MTPDDLPELDPAMFDGAGELSAPPLGALLEGELRDLRPVSSRRPWRDLAVFAGSAAAMVVIGVLALRLRRDLDALPTGWVVGFGAAWIVSFAALAWMALVPRAGAVVPRWLPAVLMAALSAAGFVLAGLTLARTTPLSLVYEPTAANHLRYAAICLTAGTLTGIVPLLIGARLLRGALPVGARAVGAGLGAACGAAGGLLLHLHCPITHAFHLGIGHGAVVGACALIGALVVPAMARVR